MSSKQSLVLFVEGEGDQAAASLLVKKLIEKNSLWDHIALDPDPFRVGEVKGLLRENAIGWIKKLGAARKRRNFGGVLLLLDGDSKKVSKKPFCPLEIGHLLSEHAKKEGAGSTFSVTSVFAMKEFESWLIAGVESLAGMLLPGERQCIKAGVKAPEGDLEKSPRDAKGWLGYNSISGYKPSRDQELLTKLVSIDLIRQRNMKSFQRLEHALEQMAKAFETGNHIVSPCK
jgi:hypothetical protein